MKLHTHVPLEPVAPAIDYTSKLVLIGSCFTEEMGGKLDYFQFNTLQNPLGILFQPRAILKLLQRALDSKPYTEKDLFYLNERWHCFDAHSALSGTDQATVLAGLNSALDETAVALGAASHVFITLGTAYAYRENESGELVANCHKLPQQAFTKELLGIEEVSSSLEEITALIRGRNPQAEIVFTISPVRHIRDGLIANQRSKAHLLAAVHALIAEGGVRYFPAYEIVMDELRDYRFYGEDLVHPNELAIDYIWEKFKQVWVAESVYGTMAEVASIRKGLEHKPFNPESQAHSEFQSQLRDRIGRIKERYPSMQFPEI